MTSIVQAMFVWENIPFEQPPGQVIQVDREGIVNVSAMMEGAM